MDTDKSLNNIHFYMNSEVCKWLFNKFGGKDNTKYELSFGDNDYFSYDVIDQPLHCEVKAGDGYLTLLLFIRTDFGIYDEEYANIHAVFHSNGEAPSLIKQSGIGGDINATALYYLKVALQLRKQISPSLYESIEDLNLEKEGVLAKLLNDEVVFERVSGRKRPSLLCNSIFEGMHMARPYTDELTSGLMQEGLSIDEKVTLAEDGDENCMEDVALTYLNGNDEVEQDFEKSAYWWEKLAETGDSQAQFNMGLFYAKGCGVTRDFEKAAEWMKKALKNGDDDAKAPYEAYSKAAENLKKAEAGDVIAQAEIAKLYTQIGGSLEQYGSGDDYRAAIEWAKKAADQGNADALWTLALAYEHGRGVEENKSKAIELYSKGVELNHPDAMNSLAACISRGEVPEKTSEDAFELIKRAAEMGNVLAMRNLGHCYQFEEGTGHDMKKAIFWYEKYLEHENDEELAQKVAIFKMMPDFDEDDSGDDPKYAKVDLSEFSNNLKKIEFKDKLFVLTGFDTREENKITQIITERGGTIKSSTVLKTDYLIVRGDYSSRKYVRAVELNKQGKSIAIISAEQFYKLIEMENTNNKNYKKDENVFDEKITFDLPRKYELVESKDDEGKTKYEICYNISQDAEGNKKAEKSYTLNKYEKEKNLVGNVESNFNVGVSGFSKDFNLGLSISSTGLGGAGRSSQITYKIYSGVAIIDYEDKWYTILTTHVGTDDYESRSSAAEDIASELTTVLGFVIIDGERLKIEPITKSFMLNKLKTENMEIQTKPSTQEEETAQLEREKKEEEEKRKKEEERRRKESEERARIEAEKRKAEEEARKKAEEKARIEAEKRKAEEKARIEAEEKRQEELRRKRYKKRLTLAGILVCACILSFVLATQVVIPGIEKAKRYDSAMELFSECVFRSHLDTRTGVNWTVIPVLSGHRFR